MGVKMRIYALIALAAVLIAGCSDSNVTGKATALDETGGKLAIIETNKGIIKMELYEGKAPITAKNFIDLAQSGFYDGLTFHRVEKGFVVQGGDPNGDGTGGSDKTIPLEINPELRHDKGVVAMARSQDPNSASSQFYITLAAAPFLDGSYAVFGRVLEGMDVVESIEVGDVMESIAIVRK
jgi:peptidyl-prolyl cis-trans isomerase B (cyclophilin B)